MTAPVPRRAVLAGLAMAAVPHAARAATLVSLLAADDPAALVDYFATLGRTIDLADDAQVWRAIGPVRGLPVRGSPSRGFVGYTMPRGEIVFNADLGDRTVLLVTLEECVPGRVILDRLRAPEFLQATSRTTVATYTDAPYRDRPGTAFTYLPCSGGCVSDFGISQRKNLA